MASYVAFATSSDAPIAPLKEWSDRLRAEGAVSRSLRRLVLEPVRLSPHFTYAISAAPWLTAICTLLTA